MGKNYQEWKDGSSSDSSDEKSSPTAASRSCTHVKKAVDSAKLRKLLKTTGLLLDCKQCLNSAAASPAAEACETPDSPGGFEYDNTLWLCLKCGSQLCGRSKNQHALQHYKVMEYDNRMRYFSFVMPEFKRKTCFIYLISNYKPLVRITNDRFLGKISLQY